MTSASALTSMGIGRPPSGFVRSLLPNSPANWLIRNSKLYFFAAGAGMLVGTIGLAIIGPPNVPLVTPEPISVTGLYQTHPRARPKPTPQKSRLNTR